MTGGSQPAVGKIHKVHEVQQLVERVGSLLRPQISAKSTAILGIVPLTKILFM